MKKIMGLIIMLLEGLALDAKAMRGYECDPSFNVETDTPNFSGYAGSLMESAPVWRDSCKGTDGLMHGEILLFDTTGNASYLFLPYKVTDNAEKLKGLVFPLEIYVSKELIHNRGRAEPVVYQRLYVVSRAKDIRDSDGTTIGFYFPRKLDFKIDLDRGEGLFKGLGGSGGNAQYGSEFRMAVDLDEAALRSLTKTKKCSMTIPFAPYRIGVTKTDLPPFTIRVTLTKVGLANLQKFIKAMQKE